MTGPRRRFLASAAAGVLALAAGAPAFAQGACGAPPAASAQPASWQAPLDRTVAFHARDVSLREALDRLSAATKVHLSYSSDLLPLDRRVCVATRGEPLGAVLARLLAGTGVEPTVVAGQVVLSPVRATTVSPEARHVTDRVNALEGIVVTGSPAGTARRSVTVGLDVVDGHDLARRHAETLPDVLNAAVPGVWAWRQGPSALIAQYGSVRGASSFGATYPKVYVDGVEAANPLLVTEIDPDEVERVEVIRGPQGAALYGSDAISGVINIVTRHEGADGDGARTTFRSLFGAAGSAFAADPPTTWEQRLGLRTGDNLASAGLALTVARTGGIVPGAGTRRIAGTADVRKVLSNAILSGSLRISDRRSGVSQNPLLADLPFSADSLFTGSPQSVRLYTLATNATIATQGPWTHTLLFGVDGYRLDYVPDAVVPPQIAGDSALRAAVGGGDRGTFRASSTLRLDNGDSDAEGTLTFTVEHSLLRQETVVTPPQIAAGMPTEPHAWRGQVWVDGEQSNVVEWRHDTGMMAQASGSWRNTLYGTAGVRLERSGGFVGGSELSTLPMLGLAWVRRVAPGAELKLRGAYGRGIRPPRTPARDHLRWSDELALAFLQPEAQSGIELGAELYLGRWASLQATRFDQRASGLIQDVSVGVDSFMQGGRVVRRVAYALQNVGAIDNTGWEMQGALNRGPLALTGTFAMVDSRVRRLAAGYGGDLRAGDRILGVPARTASLTAGWQGDGWSGTLTASRAWDWVNYDRLALARAFVSDSTGMQRLYGPQLRTFWRAYDGDTDLRATLSRQVQPGFWLVLKGENLLGTQLGEPDNLTIRAGRSLMLGAKAEF